MKTKIDISEFEPITSNRIRIRNNTLTDDRPISSANATHHPHSPRPIQKYHPPFTPKSTSTSIKSNHTPIKSINTSIKSINPPFLSLPSNSLQPKARVTPEAIPRRKQILPGAPNPINHFNPTTIFSTSSSSRTLKDHDQSDQDENCNSIQQNVLVAIRLRSFDQSSYTSIWKINETQAQIWESTSSGPTLDSSFDAVFGPDCSNEQVYQSSGTKDLIHSSMIGYDSTIFTYGQTASGKTFTLNGDRSNPGLIPLSIQDIFKFIRSHSERDFLLRASYLEIYNEQINDLLIPLSDDELKPLIKIRLDPLTKHFFPNPIREEVVTTEHQVEDLLNRGNLNRHVSGTDFNSRSSRSHTILSILIESKRNGGDHQSVRRSKVSLIDLAGSERATSDSNRRTEGAFINKSLLTLEKVIGALSSDQTPTSSSSASIKHIPFRDSKLTQILQPALNGNSKVCVICTINPTLNHRSTGITGNGLEESKSTLRFARRVKKVKVKAVVGEILSERALITRYRQQIIDLQNQLDLAIQATSSSSSISNPTTKTKAEEVESNQESFIEEREEILERLEKLQSIVLNAGNLDEFCLKKRRESGWVRPVSPIKVGNRDEEEEDDELEEVCEESQIDDETIKPIESKLNTKNDYRMKEIDLMELNELRLIISNSLNSSSSNEIEINETKIKERYDLKLVELLNENLERKRFGEEMVKLLEASQLKAKKLELFMINELQNSLKKNGFKKKIRRSSIGTYFTQSCDLNYRKEQEGNRDQNQDDQDGLLDLMNEVPEIRSLRASFGRIEIGDLD